ncbi:HAD family hydrolase [Megalodesulfovibrio gigas]|uniref:Putative haloacid dehalogenase domain-containing protein hydrolase n=1 Tax=Megalodesulfovibrio gigas (strain ATCC 19364 / DSM 1382 / NCIMB 9332 / VKM B-1759) TaxID=1121448 RepID=T2GFK4_MEGG1|nr:HAD family hydrolase [Megalodesulfovibrio gigas]AGW14969.1 putative haloacid dehalogenase domain-containing protein hydrolase [Megalodesulfovibrio gigas DSM 1382 = ATCC 19364]
MNISRPRAVLFDFGGVIAREGFLDALTCQALARSLEPSAVIAAAVEAMYGSGYLTNTAGEDVFWDMFEARSGLRGERLAMRQAILDGCIPRQEMLALASALAVQGVVPAILSDHTDWLDELERRHGFFMHFEYVFNSYHTGSTKRQTESFRHALGVLDMPASDVLFIDDARRNVALARELGIRSILFEEPAVFAREFLELFPDMAQVLEPFGGG